MSTLAEGEEAAIHSAMLVLTLACAYTSGRAPVAIDAASLGEIRAIFPEDGLQDALRGAVAEELDRRARLGAGPALSAEVLDASVRSVAAGGGVQEARLQIRFSLEGAPESVIVSSKRGFLLTPGDPYATNLARQEAFAALASELCAQAIPRLLMSPL